MPATRMCHGLAATVGEPSSVAAAGRGQPRREQRPDGEADDDPDQAEHGDLDREHLGDLARRQTDGLQQPDLAVLRGWRGRRPGSRRRRRPRRATRSCRRSG